MRRREPLLGTLLTFGAGGSLCRELAFQVVAGGRRIGRCQPSLHSVSQRTRRGFMASILDQPAMRQATLPMTVEQYHHLSEQSIISERTELLRGVIIEQMTKLRHARPSHRIGHHATVQLAAASRPPHDESLRVIRGDGLCPAATDCRFLAENSAHKSCSDKLL